MPLGYHQMRIDHTPDLVQMMKCMASARVSWRWSDGTKTAAYCGALSPGGGGFRSPIAPATFPPLPFYLC